MFVAKQAPAVIVSPTLFDSKVQRRTVVTFPTEMATLQCHPVEGRRLNAIPMEHRQIELALKDAFNQTVNRMRIRGYELAWEDDVHVYGPWPSRLFHERLITPDEIHTPEQARDHVWKAETSPQEYADYLLVANWIHRDVLVEVPDPTENEKADYEVAQERKQVPGLVEVTKRW